MTDIITYHGWGFSSAIWKDWEPLLPAEVTISHADKGYFGEKYQPVFRKEAARKIIITHSFGLHWCPAGILREADHLVIVSGFLAFHPRDSAGNRRSRLVLQQMMSRFVEKPEEVLRTFYQRTFAPAESPVEMEDSFSHDRLLEDLERLGTSGMNPELLHQLPEITIIQGEDDKIVSNMKAREMFSILRRRSQYFEIKHAGHGVPFTHSEQCCKFLLPVFLNDLQEKTENEDDKRK